MKPNMSGIDRIIRTIISVALIVLAATGVLTGAVAILAYVFAVVFLFTAAVSWCPLYALFGLKTRKA